VNMQVDGPIQVVCHHAPPRLRLRGAFVKSYLFRFSVIPAKANQRRSLAGIQSIQYFLDAGSSPA
jgi:hypothetical protein